MNKNKLRTVTCLTCVNTFSSAANRNVYCSLICRLSAEVKKLTVQECWEWQGHRDKDGYGRLRFRYKEYGAHRAAYELEFGAIPNGLIVLHTCDNPCCCNPNHLVLGTYHANAVDRDNKGRGSGPYGERNGNAKLTNEQVKMIIADSRKHEDIAVDFGIKRHTVSRIKSGTRRAKG